MVIRELSTIIGTPAHVFAIRHNGKWIVVCVATTFTYTGELLDKCIPVPITIMNYSHGNKIFV